MNQDFATIAINCVRRIYGEDAEEVRAAPWREFANFLAKAFSREEVTLLRWVEAAETTFDFSTTFEFNDLSLEQKGDRDIICVGELGAHLPGTNARPSRGKT
jgi:hypothetical protein